VKAALRAVAAAGALFTALFRPRAASRVARALLKAMGVRWSVVGAELRPGALLTGNHVSWLDIVVMMAVAAPMATRPRLRMVAKTEVGGWPVIGKLARESGVIFVDRSRPRMLPATVAEVSQALRSGDTIQVFPEGTTTCGAHPARWRPAFLQAALDAGAPVQRFTLLFSTQKAAFVADESLLASLWRVLRLRGLSITVLVDEAQRVGATNRKELAARLSPKRLGLEKRVHDGRRA
jgi:1-acyl-sn-glycerol-3-phosphate acyltransferase